MELELRTIFSEIDYTHVIGEDMSIIIGKVHEEYIRTYLEVADADFYEPLSSRVNLGSYAKKLHELSTMFVIVCENKVAGLISSYFYDKSSLKGFITLVHVNRDFRGRHLSDLLVREVLKFAETTKFKYVDLVVYRDNVSAYYLYLKHGFRVVSEDNGRCMMRVTINEIV